MVQLHSAVHELLQHPQLIMKASAEKSVIVVLYPNEERCIGSRVMSYYEQWILVQRAGNTHSTLINPDAQDL